MRKRIIFIAIFFIGITYIFYVLNNLAPIITGYAAKNLASGIFVGNRTQESIEKEDLYFFPIKLNKNKVDYEKKEVISRFLFWTAKAIYIDGFGCTLVHDFTEDEIRARAYTTSVLPELNTDTIAWPAGDRIADTIPTGIRMDKLTEALDLAFVDTVPFKGTFAVAVAYKNQLVAERYGEGLSADNLFLSWSMAKSYTNTLIGILVKQGKINIDQQLNIPGWDQDQRSEITLKNLLCMNSGLEWNENYGSNSDVNRMLFKNGDMALFAQEKPLLTSPGTKWYYSSGTTNIVCNYIRDVIENDKEYYAFPRRELFEKTGMRSAIFETDASGTFAGSSYLYASMRDYVRYGLLYLNKGNWLGEQILPETWIDFTVTPASGSEGRYGAFFWLNKSKDYPDVPEDMYSCRGHDGQYIIIIPSKELVVVRTGFSQKGVFDPNLFLKKILAAIE